jgi:hypothetical protein
VKADRTGFTQRTSSNNHLRPIVLWWERTEFPACGPHVYSVTDHQGLRVRCS